MDDGPTNGLTVIWLLWAMLIISAPGSATPGTPASESNPTLKPFFIGDKKRGKSLALVCLFNSKKVKSSILEFIPSLIKNLLAVIYSVT